MKKYYLASVCFLAVISSCLAQQKNEPYAFPVKPGTEAWKKIKTTPEMYEVCQIPPPIIKTLSTQALVKTCLDYPLLNNILAYNDLQTGFEAVTKNFNGLQELLKRKDSGIELMKVYQKMKPDTYSNEWSLQQKGDFAFQFTYIEVVLAQYLVQATLSDTERKELVKMSLEKFKIMDDNPEIFGGFGLLTSAWVMGRILEKQLIQANNQTSKADSSQAMQLFLSRAIVQNTQVINQIIADVQTYLR